MDWDRSRQWVLQKMHAHRARVRVRFASMQPTIAEIAAVRTAFPRFANLPPRDVQAQLGATGELTFDDVGAIEANGLARAAEQAGLRVAVDRWVATSFLIMDETDPAMPFGWLIEDDAEKKQMVEEMIAAGVKVVEVISD
jgi:hypothetical protein